MRLVDPVAHASLDPVHAPSLLDGDVALRRHGRAAVGEHAPRARSRVFSANRVSQGAAIRADGLSICERRSSSRRRRC